MSEALVVNGNTYNYPDVGDQNWGTEATNWAIAVTGGMLQKAGGSFVLTADVDFGANFGLKSLYYKSRSANLSSAGMVRLANTDTIGWRNAANSGNLLLVPDAGNDLLKFNSIDLVDISTSQTLTNKSMSGSSNTFTNLPASALLGVIKSDGSVPLTADWDAGSFIISASAFSSKGTHPATQGIFRLANTETIAWRNAANSSEKVMSLNASDNFTLNSALDMQGNALDEVSTLQFSGSISGNLVHQAAATTTSHTLTWPSTQGASNSVLQNNGSGTLSWGTNIATATALQTARTINGTSFDGTANITVTAAAGTLTGATLASNVLASSLTSVGTLAALTVTATITGSVSGNAATATALQNARTINGTSFDGTGNITVTAAAGTLTGTTLNSTVVTSSLTTLGSTSGATTLNGPNSSSSLILTTGVNNSAFSIVTDGTNKSIFISGSGNTNGGSLVIRGSAQSNADAFEFNGTSAKIVEFRGDGRLQLGATSGTAQHLINGLSATSATAGSNGAVPAQVSEYLVFTYNGNTRKIALFNS